MNSGIIYLLTGRGHAVRLVVSLWSLRRFYAGPVTVYTTQPESHEIGRLCAADPRLAASHVVARAVNVRRNSDFITKVALLPEVPYDSAAYLDCDTLVVGNLGPLLTVSAETEFHATQFSNWLATSRNIQRRIERWRGLRQNRFDPVWLEKLIDGALCDVPAVNGGVFGFHRQARILKTWFDLAMAGWRTFICDEVALQLLLPRFRHRVLDCRFNCSPIYGVLREDARIWHFHGEKHVSRDVARELWWPAYETCLRLNVAELASWTPCGDTELIAYLQARAESIQ